MSEPNLSTKGLRLKPFFIVYGTLASWTAIGVAGAHDFWRFWLVGMTVWFTLLAINAIVNER